MASVKVKVSCQDSCCGYPYFICQLHVLIYKMRVLNYMFLQQILFSKGSLSDASHSTYSSRLTPAGFSSGDGARSPLLPCGQACDLRVVVGICVTFEASSAKILALEAFSLHVSSPAAMSPQIVRKPRAQSSLHGETVTWRMMQVPKSTQRARSAWPAPCYASSNPFLTVATLETPGRPSQPGFSSKCWPKEIVC